MRSQTEQLRRVIAEQAASWLVAQSDGQLDAASTREFMQWLRMSPMHIEEYLVVSRLSGTLAEAARRNQSSWQSLTAEDARVVTFAPNQSDAVPSTPVPRANKGSPIGWLKALVAPMQPRWPVGWAATFAGLTIAALMVLGARWPITGATLMTRQGEIRTVVLPDQSLVTLDSDSSISVRFDRHARHVVLNHGQAYFDIRNHDGPQFTVAVGPASIRDIGTQFNVRREPASTVVTVSTGLVEISEGAAGKRQPRTPTANDPGVLPRNSSAMTMVGGGEQSTITRTGRVTPPRAVDVAQTMAWVKSKIDFKDSSIASIASELNRYNTTQIAIKSAQIRNLPITGVIGVNDTDAFVAFLGGLPGVKIDRRGKTIVVMRDHDAAHPHGANKL